MSSKLENSYELLEQLSCGSEIAFNTIYHQFNRDLYNAVIVYVKDSYLAKEIVQITFIKIWDNRASLVKVKSLENYLFIIARNTLFDYLKKIVAQSKQLDRLYNQLPKEVNDAGKKVEEKDAQYLFQSAVNQLPPQQKQVYLLAHEMGLSLDEIATRLQLSKETIKRHLGLARKSVRLYINQNFHYDILIAIALSSFLISPR
ncbi:RNA polymerase sigma-70 factor (ECF subfamily) [Chitinophaga niastensis]|uniref:RNA polymerase sigma-70 factor (ECF subfamily) n=1 Tax=Chitinophaga niastensis TaxID=536980 RepID=A0A2P8HA73_CHINA|nr:sigma-70 family RNA polymerase sigma factor [Chitinophaga niastensis]PSL43079.1 RNA polymerase sigma-70 factor (ECF subfamily) [Chitinophaga niastensis]